MSKKSSIISARLGIVLLAWVVGCAEKPSKDNGNLDKKQEVKAPLGIGSSFSVENVSVGLDQVSISIKKDALEKEFLLQSGITVMPFLGTSQGLKSRVVAFRRIENDLYMLEATQGHIVSEAIPQVFLLAKFPITGETFSEVAFDFNAGMTSLFVADDWRASDFDGSEPTYNSEGLKTRLSFLESADINGSNQLVIRQIAQLDMPSATVVGGNVEFEQDHTTVEVKYYLSPYEPDPEFESVPTTDFRSFGYFEIAPQYREGSEEVVYATKFGKGPIAFTISANTPDEFKQAVRDGILYWNKAFGEEIITAVDGPEGIVAPDFNHNVIQWVDWDTAGFAYADAQMDPRTGEILHAQVYMTSAFAVGGRNRAQELIDDLEIDLEDAEAKETAVRSIGLTGFEKRHLCHIDLTRELVTGLKALVREDATDVQVQKVVSDYIREVIAHEVGHTLGLRHNFAGSLAQNFPVSEKKAVFKRYVEGGQAPDGIVAANTVMDYQLFINSALTGDLTVSGADALAYDKNAITNLYKGPIDPGEVLFCTDTLEGSLVGCKVFDEGISTVESIVGDIEDRQALLSETTPIGDEEVPLIYILSSDTVASYLSAPWADAVALFSDASRVLKVRRTVGLPASLEESIRAIEVATIAGEIETYGGISAILPLAIELPDPVLSVLAPAKLALKVALLEAMVKALDAAVDVVDHPLGEVLAAHMGELTKTIVQDTSGEPIVITLEKTDEDAEAQTLELPRFTYDFSLRSKAAALLNAGHGLAIDFALAENIAIKNSLLDQLNTALGQDIVRADIETLPPEARRWVLENQKVIANFSR